MIYDYEKLYASTQSALGEPTSQLVEFFEPRQEPKLRVLDFGVVKDETRCSSHGWVMKLSVWICPKAVSGI